MADSIPDTAKPTPTEFREPERFDYSAFACPRCQTTVSLAQYRPCDACMVELKATQRGEAGGGGDAQDLAFEPKMNVTPNAVALKDD